MEWTVVTVIIALAGLMATVGALKNRCESQGATFDDELTGQDLLDACEAWMDEQEAAAKEAANQPTTEERIAAALEYQNLLSL